MGNRLEGESRFIPNLQFDLSNVQLVGVSETLRKLENAHRAKVAWIGPYSLLNNRLSIHALDLFSVLTYCQRNSENEMDLFRLRKAAIDQLDNFVKSARNEIKKQNLEMWIEAYKKLWPGAESDIDVSVAPVQPSRIELVL